MLVELADPWSSMQEYCEATHGTGEDGLQEEPAASPAVHLVRPVGGETVKYCRCTTQSPSMKRFVSLHHSSFIEGGTASLLRQIGVARNLRDHDRGTKSMRSSLFLLLLLGSNLPANAFHVPLRRRTPTQLSVAASPPGNHGGVSLFETAASKSMAQAPSHRPRQTLTVQEVPSTEPAALEEPHRVAWNRGKEVISIILVQVLMPLFRSVLSGKASSETDFWESTDTDGLSNADRVVQALETLGCTYVKFGQALASRPDLVPAPLAKALAKLQDNMEPFSTSVARDIVIRELLHNPSSSISAKDLESLLTSLSALPVAAASIGQVYKAHLPRFGAVAVKVRRPNIQQTIARDAALLRAMASFVESLSFGDNHRLVKAKLVDAVEEFMGRLQEELDYQNEAQNIRLFGDLYSHRRSSDSANSKVRVVVPQVLDHLCTDNVLVMEWIEGTKLTDVDTSDPQQVQENLALIQMGIECTLSQLLETGILHADPHSANLIKVPREGGNGSQLGYLDFGLISSVPETVRDALVCSVAQLVFARDVEAVASLFGELQLLPSHVLEDSDRTMALTRALDRTFQQVLEYPMESSDDGNTRIPHLKFDRLLESLATILPEFEFQLPPYFLSNCRALAIMEGNARMLDPQFSVLKVLYPYALNRLLLNPSGSPVVDDTLRSLMTDPRTNAYDVKRIVKILDDSAALTGFSRKKVLLDVLSTTKGRQVARTITVELARARISGGRRRRRIKQNDYFRL